MTVLLVEDDLTINENIKEALEAEGYEVESVFDGFMAEKALKKGHFDCVILDINLPYKNGYDLCRGFRLTNTLTPVLMLTAFDELEDKVQGFDCGADDYLVKPFYMKEVLMRIRSLIKRSNTVKNDQLEVITIDDMVINQKAKTVNRGSSEIILTPREYQILVKLAQAKGEPVSKKELIHEIWGGSFDANANTIEVFINFLRKKVDKPFEKQLIKTKVGYGYYFDI